MLFVEILRCFNNIYFFYDFEDFFFCGFNGKWIECFYDCFECLFDIYVFDIFIFLLRVKIVFVFSFFIGIKSSVVSNVY